MLNLLRGKELNKFRPPTSSDDLCLLFCLILKDSVIWLAVSPIISIVATIQEMTSPPPARWPPPALWPAAAASTPTSTSSTAAKSRRAAARDSPRAWAIFKIRKTVGCSGCDDDGAHCYFGPPRLPDEVLDALRRSEPCGIGRSFWGS